MDTPSSDGIEIRPALPRDAEVLVDFQVRMARETEELELEPEVVSRGVQAVLDDAMKGRYWVADSGGHLVGSLLTTYEWSDWRDGTVLWVQSVYVVPALRGRGVYRRMYEHLRGLVLASPDLRGIRLYVDRRNLAAQRVYERLGMSREHYEMFEWMKG
jgi:GNAT superfamily N-acetyltransferase